MVDIEWTAAKRKGLKRALDAAIKRAGDSSAANHAVFEYDGEHYIVGYAKYLLGYLDTALPPARRTYARSRGGR